MQYKYIYILYIWGIRSAYAAENLRRLLGGKSATSSEMVDGIRAGNEKSGDGAETAEDSTEMVWVEAGWQVLRAGSCASQLEA